MEACGLKWLASPVSRASLAVTPYGGVWIEISIATGQFPYSTSRLMEACGLKYTKFQIDIFEEVSRLMEACGLKCRIS